MGRPIPQMTGITASADTVVYDIEATPTTEVYEANGAIDVGDLVGYDITALVAGSGNRLVVAVDTDEVDDFAILGVYAGEGGTNGETARTAMDGKIAQDGDQIRVVTSGRTTCWGNGSGTAIAAGSPLGPSAAAGVAVPIASPVAGTNYKVIALAASSTNGVAIACMVM